MSDFYSNVGPELADTSGSANDPNAQQAGDTGGVGEPASNNSAHQQSPNLTLTKGVSDMGPQLSNTDADAKDDGSKEYETILDLNDAEQLRFIAEQLESLHGNGSNDKTDDNGGPGSANDDNTNGDMNEDFPIQPSDFDYTDRMHIPDDEFRYSIDSRRQLLIDSLPVLDNLAMQILNTMGRQPYQSTLTMVTQPDSEQGQSFAILMSLFEQTKRLYSSTEPFISGSSIGIRNREQKNIVQKANMATFCAAVFGALEVGFYHLHEFFLDSFVPDNMRLLKSHGALFLELKTQAYISAMSQAEKTQKDILDDLFPEDLDQILINRRNSKSLAPSEVDFVSRCRSRRDRLSLVPSNAELSETYGWLSFLKETVEHVSKVYLATLVGKKTTPATTLNTQTPLGSAPVSGQTSVAPSAPTSPRVNRRPKPTSELVLPAAEEDDDAARFAVSRTAVPVRRPWTKAEEAALMHGLRTVNGPFWAQILEIYGPGGTMSEVLKDRNQVQLKDKARNLKLYFLKAGVKVPECLQFVTGGIKNRGRVRRNMTAEPQQQQQQQRQPQQSHTGRPPQQQQQQQQQQHPTQAHQQQHRQQQQQQQPQQPQQQHQQHHNPNMQFSLPNIQQQMPQQLPSLSHVHPQLQQQQQHSHSHAPLQQQQLGPQHTQPHDNRTLEEDSLRAAEAAAQIAASLSTLDEEDNTLIQKVGAFINN